MSLYVPLPYCGVCIHTYTHLCLGERDQTIILRVYRGGSKGWEVDIDILGLARVSPASQPPKAAHTPFTYYSLCNFQVKYFRLRKAPTTHCYPQHFSPATNTPPQPDSLFQPPFGFYLFLALITTYSYLHFVYFFSRMLVP